LSSLRLLSTSTSILSDPSLVPEQAIQAVSHGHSSLSYSQWQHTLSNPQPTRPSCSSNHNSSDQSRFPLSQMQPMMVFPTHIQVLAYWW